MRARMLAFCLGVIVCGAVPVLPDFSPLFAWMLALLCLALSRCSDLRLAVLAALCCGLSWGVGGAQWRLQALLPAELEGQDFWVQGRVSGLPERQERAQQFLFRVSRSCFALLPEDCAANEPRFRHRLVQLNYYGDVRIVPGQQWWWRVRLNRPHGFANPGSFDYEAWLLMQGVAARGYVRETAFNRLLGPGRPGLQRMRDELRERLAPLLAPLSNSGILLALILGDRSRLPASQWDLFTATGTNHLVVISGLHVGFMALLGYGIGNLLARLFPALLLRLPAQKWGALSAVLAALLYSLLAGFSLPTQRALTMVLVFMSGRLLARELLPSFAYWLAMSVVLLGNPLSPLGAGFWLSFGAVGTLMFAFAARIRLRSASGDAQGWAGRIRQWCEPQFTVFVGMLLPLLLWTGQSSLLAPLANLVAIPLVSLLVVPLALTSAGLLMLSPVLASYLLWAADALLSLLLWGLQCLADGEGGHTVLMAGPVSAMAVFLAVVGTVMLLFPPGWPGRWLGFVCFAPLLWPRSLAPAPGQVTLTVLDVGQGLAIVARTAGHTLLYDSGPAFSEDFDAGAGIVVPFLQRQGVRRLDTLVISHGDSDHRGGMPGVLAAMPVARQLLSLPAPLPAGAQPCHEGQGWEWDGVRFDMLGPAPGGAYLGNDSSCVLRIEAGGQVALLTGDIERPAEARLLAGQHDLLRADLLIAPHHGSNTSSSPAFIAAVAPHTVVFSAGYRSQFGHPAPGVAERYHALGIRAWNTALSGALGFVLGDAKQALQAWTPVEYRQQALRYWRLPASVASRRLHGVCFQQCAQSALTNQGELMVK
ncbi:MAG: DNA internalization-related competence protein ComEC/Rec2 [Pseudomonadales bacterium]|nr:DNA internalization-related competence protein ComEC/Rec2 [Pseudomonadales bacterium]MCP5331646.1 DNA internalization-related competence protein ComEC/Rec2 [Pseudomonadales bacterium]MCP5344723.1 DNA internalization-related competence protein ComEC/Rec2 [Pseudomonadales bacterium]